MADSVVTITSGTGTNIDTRTEDGASNHRQVVVLGDPTANAGVAPVDGTAGVKVNLGADNDVTVTGTVDLGVTDNAVLDTIDAVLDTIKIDTEAIETAVEGTLTVDGSGVTQPVSGTVTANLSATDNTVLDNIDTDTSAIATDIAANEVLLTTIAGDTTSIDADVTTIIGHVDGIETLLGTIDGDTSTIAGDTTSIDGKITTCNTGAVAGTVTANLSSTDNAVLDTIDAVLDTIKVDTEAIETAVELLDDPVATIAATPLMRVAVFDDSDAQVTSFGGGTQYTEDGAAPANPVGTAMMMERDDVLAGLTPAAGDWTHPFATAEGSLWTQDFNSDTQTAHLSEIEGAVETIEGAVAAGQMQVDIVADGAGLATSAGQLADGHNVTIDNAAAGAAVNIQDGGNTITVDGTVTANLSATDNTVLDNIDTDTTTIAGDTTSIDADTTTIAADTTSIDADTTTIIGHVDGIETVLGTIDTDTGAMVTDLAAMEALLITIDSDTNTIQSDTTAILADTASMDTNLGTIDTDTGNIATYTAGAETALEAMDGAIIGPGEPDIDSYTQASINLSAAANQVLVASAASKQIWVYGITYTCSVAGTVSFQDEDDTAITGIMDHAANSGLAVAPSGNFAMPIWKLATNKDLEVDVVTAAIDGWIDYAIVSV